MKTCTNCKIEKDKSEFPRDASRKTGLFPICKVCNCARVAKWKANNPEVLAKRYAANREAHKAECAEWRANNPEKAREHLANWHAVDREVRNTRRARGREELSDSCVANYLGLRNPPPELIELKREQLKMYRTLRQLKQTIKDKQDE